MVVDRTVLSIIPIRMYLTIDVAPRSQCFCMEVMSLVDSPGPINPINERIGADSGYDNIWSKCNPFP